MKANPERAVLSAMLHPDREIATVMLNQLQEHLEEERRPLYCEAVLRALPAGERRAVEATMQESLLLQTFHARTFMARGKKEGLVEGRKEGKAQALRDTALKLARLKLKSLSTSQLAGLKAVQNDRRLTNLILALGQAEGREQARAALERTIANP